MVIYLLLLLLFLYSIFSSKKALGSDTGDSWQGFPISPSIVEIGSVSIGQSQHDMCPFMVFAGLLRFCHLKPQPRRTSVSGTWPARARNFLLGQPSVWATLHLLGCDWWFPAAASCSGVPRDDVWSTAVVSLPTLDL